MAYRWKQHLYKESNSYTTQRPGFIRTRVCLKGVQRGPKDFEPYLTTF